MNNKNHKSEVEKRNERLLENKQMIIYSEILFIGIVLVITNLVNFSAVVTNIIWILTVIICFIGALVAVKFESDAGYYKCEKCGHLHKPSFKQVLNAMHMGTTRYLKCPECGKHSWSKKVLDKE